jgi:hypothetical protein
MDVKIDELTRAKQEFQAALAGEMKFTPLQVMHAIMLLRISQGDHEGALMAAREAAPYCHARLNATDVRLQHSIADRPDSEIAAEIVALRTKLDAARSLPAPPITIEATARPVELVEAEPAGPTQPVSD